MKNISKSDKEMIQEFQDLLTTKRTLEKILSSRRVIGEIRINLKQSLQLINRMIQNMDIQYQQQRNEYHSFAKNK